MARMLGRIALGYDHDLGTERDTRTAKLIERRTFRRELLLAGELDVPTDVLRDCRHGCDGECTLHGGPDVCGLTCHPGPVWRQHADQFHEDDEMVRGYVTALWAEDWQSPEDNEYDRCR